MKTTQRFLAVLIWAFFPLFLPACYVYPAGGVAVSQPPGGGPPPPGGAARLPMPRPMGTEGSRSTGITRQPKSIIPRRETPISILTALTGA